jgi:hypothetical protein
MRKVKVKCLGTSALLMDKFTAHDSTCSSPKTDKQLMEEKIYRNECGRIGLPSLMLFMALNAAAKKFGRKQCSRTKNDMISDLMRIEEEFIFLTDGTGKRPEFVPDVRRAIFEQGKTCTVCRLVRPRFDHWGFNVTIVYDEKKVYGETLHNLFDFTGFSNGLCFYRPERGGPFGRFKVISWIETNSRISTIHPVVRSGVR